jgi:hypothetical protein
VENNVENLKIKSFISFLHRSSENKPDGAGYKFAASTSKFYSSTLLIAPTDLSLGDLRQ